MLSFGILVPTFFVPVELGSVAHLIAIGVAVVTSFIVWEGSKFIQAMVSYYFPWEKSITERLVYELGFIFILSAIGLILGIFSYALLVGSVDRITLGVVLQNVFVCFALAVLFTAVNEGQFLFRKWKSSLVEQERLIQEAKIESLKKQLDPHFLFNSLSVLSGVIHQDTELADEFITKMSQVYRYAIEHNQSKEVLLSDELKFARAYYFLLNVRFPDKIVLDVEIKDQLNAKVLPLTLQLLIENAVKHNSMVDRLTIKVIETPNSIIVENNLMKRNDDRNSTQIGLKNLDARYRLLTGKRVHVLENENKFIVEVPIID